MEKIWISQIVKQKNNAYGKYGIINFIAELSIAETGNF